MNADIAQQFARAQGAQRQLSGYVLPAPPRGSRDQLITTPLEPAPVPGLSESVAQAIGARLQLRAESMQQLLAELRERGEGTDAGVGQLPTASQRQRAQKGAADGELAQRAVTQRARRRVELLERT